MLRHTLIIYMHTHRRQHLHVSHRGAKTPVLNTHARPQEAVACIGEEVVRGGSGAPLAQLLAALEPALRRATGSGVWQVR